MKKFKKTLALGLALTMGLSLVACGKSDDKKDDTTTTAPSTEDSSNGDADKTTDTESDAVDEVEKMEMTTGNGEKVHVYAWNDELGGIIDKFLKKDYPELSDLVVYHNLNVGGTSAEYIIGLQNAFETNEAPDLIAADIDAAKNLMAQDFTVPLSEIGFDSKYYANAYDYTVEYATNENGELMATTWQVTPGVLCYRADIAEEVLGVSDPEDVAAAVSDWDKFFDVAAKMKEAGYYMTSGFDDIKYPMLDSRTQSWVVDGKLVLDSSIDKYLEYSKKLFENGYTTETTMWQGDWTPNMSGNVFCYFGCTWFVAFSLTVEEGSKAEGNWRVCTPPSSYHWGGSFLMAAKDCKNPELAAFVVYYLTCDEDHLYDQATNPDTMNYPNNKKVAKALLDAGEGSMAKLGGQNPYPLYDELLSTVDLSLSTKWDNQLNGYLDSAVTSYATGAHTDVQQAKDYIMEQVIDNVTDVTVE